jgi:aerobic-type carbon monoxide dehydrogenase small subunit (CoxS/CutS family)
MRAILTVNETSRTVDADADTPLLWVLRDLLGLTGTKYGCGAGICGSCTILEGAEQVRACQIPLAEAAGRSFTTVEGLPPLEHDPIRQAWLDEDVSQCGYCQPGVIMKVRALLATVPGPTDDQINSALDDHVCRCGSYTRIRRAIHTAAQRGGAR